DMVRAHELSQRLINLGQRIPPSRLPWAHQQMGCVHYFGGQPARALDQFDRAVAAFETAGHRQFMNVFGQDAVVASLTLAGMCRWLRGRPHEGIVTGRAGVARAREINHPFSLGFALSFLGYNYVQCRDAAGAREVGEEAERLSQDQALWQWTFSAMMLCGWAA